MKFLPKIPPALVLFVAAPVFGELFSGSSPLNEFINPVTFATLALLYGCGAVLCRELVIRWHKGWFSLFLLGMAYGIFEEGLLVQSFFDPIWQDLGSLAVYGRAAGVNWVWAEHLTIFHALVSISASIAFVEILYPERRRETWIQSRGWWWLNWAGLLGIYAVWEVMTTYNPGIWKWLSWLAVLLLVLAARLIPQHPRQVSSGQPARPLVFWLLGFLGMLFQFVIVYSPSERQTLPYQWTMLILAGYDAVIFWLVWRWSVRCAAWDDRHRLALIVGALCLFLILGPLTVGSQYPVMFYSHPVFLLGLCFVYSRVSRRFRNAGQVDGLSPQQI